MKTLEGNSGEMSLRKILFNEISGNLSNSQVFKDCYADTIMNLEDSKSSTKFYKNVIKSFRSTFDEVILMNCRLLGCQILFSAFQQKNQCFQNLRADNIQIICVWIIFYLQLHKHFQQHTFRDKYKINIVIFDLMIMIRPKLYFKSLILYNFIFIQKIKITFKSQSGNISLLMYNSINIAFLQKS